MLAQVHLQLSESLSNSKILLVIPLISISYFVEICIL